MQITAISFFAGIYQRIIAFVLTIISFFVPAKPYSVNLTVLSASSNTVSVEYKNDTGRPIGTEKKFCIEKQTEKGFEPLEFCEDAAFPEIYEELLPGGKGILTVSIPKYFNSPLEAGTYRIVLFYYCEAALSATAEFTVE